MGRTYIYPKILAEMKKHKESQIELGKILGMTDETLRFKLSGTKQWKINEIEMLCKHYKKNYYELFR